MQLVQFITIDDISKPVSKRKAIVWCTTNELKIFLNFMQYILDSFNNPQDFMILDVEKGIVYDMYKCATEMYKMRKRTFDERMKNIQTGNGQNNKIAVLSALNGEKEEV